MELVSFDERAVHAGALDESLLRAYVPELLLRWPAGARWQELDGTLVSADISGFTALSERLAVKGREGSEELTALINSCFDPMIEDCARHGGDIVKFGGDALLVWFEGDHHLARACRASVAMRTTVRSERRTNDGRRVRLGVSIGLHAGRHRFVLVAAGHDEVLVSGPGPSATVDAESDASAGEILLSPLTGAMLPSSWLSVRRSQGVPLRRTFGRSDVPHLPAATHPPSRFVPLDQQAQIIAGALNEHRLASIAFVEFSGTDALAADVLAERLQRLADEVAAVVEDLGVFWLSTDVYHNGGKVILTAGAPISLGGDEDRMLRAVRRLVDRDPGLSLRAGVNRGYVFVGALGSSRRQTYTAMGDAMNLAARLMAKAATGEIVVSRPMIDWASSNFQYEPLEPFLVKGKSNPIYAGRLGQLLGRRDDLDTVDTELCGRVDQLAALLHRADAAIAGVGSVSLITGEPGIGKSRLALEVVRRRPQLTIAFARCQPYDKLSAFAVAAPVLRSLFGMNPDAGAPEAGELLIAWLRTAAPHLLPFAPLLAAPIGAEVATTPESDAVAAEFRRVRTVQLVVDLLRDAVVTPTAVIVDDINLADDASRELLAALVDAAATMPLLLLATSVPEEDLFSEAIHLDPLDERDVAGLLDALLGDRAIGADTIRLLVTRSGGNPLFAGELVRGLAENPDAPLPDSLEALVASRVDALSAEDRLLLRQASVMGTEVDIGALGQVIGDALIRRQDRWERLHRFVEWVSPGVIRFRYDTYWRVVYDGLSFSARRAAHRRLIEVIEAASDEPDHATLALLATHSDRSADSARSWRYGVAAAGAAAARSQFGEASRLYEIALRARQACPDRSAIAAAAEDAADAAERSGRLDTAREALHLANQLVVDDAHRARIHRKRGEISERLGEPLAASRSYAKARALWARAPWTAGLAERAELDAATAGLAYRQARYGDAWPLATGALARATMLEEWGIAARAGLVVSNLTLYMRGRGAALERPDLIALYQRAGDRVGEARALNNLAVDEYFDGRWEQAAEMYRRAAELCVTVGDVIHEATALNNIGEILSDQGRLHEADTVFRSAGRTWRSVGYATGVALIEANLGRLATRRGDHEEAADLLHSALARFERLDAGAFVVECRLRLVENTLAADGTVGAGELAPGDEWDSTLRVYALRLAAINDVRSGAFASAAAAIDQSVAEARDAQTPFELAQSLVVRASMTGEASSEAATILASLGVRDVVAVAAYVPRVGEVPVSCPRKGVSEMTKKKGEPDAARSAS